MADLSHVSDLTRKVLEIIGISIVAIILLFVFFNIGIIIKNIIAPTPPAPPTVAFGKLDKLSFPESFNTSTYSYSVNTLSGTLPALPDRVTVYKLEQPAPNLLSLDKAKTVATNAKFLDQPVALSDTSYRWTKTDLLPMQLTIDIQSLDFTLTSSFRTDKTVNDALNMPDEEAAQTVAKTFFDEVMPLPDYIDSSKTKTTLLAITGKGLTPASSLSNAQIIRIDYFPKAIEKLPIYTATPDTSLNYALIASSDSQIPQLVEAQFYHKNVTSDKATYPIKKASSAYEELKQGKGYVAANPTGDTAITITNVSLGYYIDASNQTYLWPIIVFQGDKGFYAYVSAVTDEWVQK
jgi:hypothetical protein